VTTTCLVVDDQAMVREGFSALLSAQDDMVVVGQAPNGAEAVRLCRILRPDVVLMDIRMPVMDGLDAIRLILSDTPDASDATDAAAPRVLVLTTFDLDEYVYEALRAGASGFILKDAPAEELVRAVRIVARGDALLAPSVTRRLIADFSRPRRQTVDPATDLDELTPRENEIFRLIARGLSNREIRERLYISDQTTKTHVGRVLAKLGLRDRAQAIVLAYESGVVRPGEDLPHEP
jgi:DNA-binding NarL/FixJ family response regulator